MFENRNRQLDVAALALVAITLLVGLSLITYHRSDPCTLAGESVSMVYPPAESPQNACGRLGAVLAYQMLDKFGIGAYFVLGSLIVVTGLTLLQRSVNQWLIRSVGWGLTLVAICTLASLLLPNWTPGPVVGAGGYLGAMGRAWLQVNFAQAGALIFTFSVLAAGLLLCTDYLVLQVAATTTKVSGRSLATLGRATTSSLRPKTDLENGVQLEDEEEYETDEYEYEDEGEWEEDYEDEEEEDADSAPLTVRTPGDKQSEAADTAEAEEQAAKSATKSPLGRVASRIASALSGEAKPDESEEVPAEEEAAEQESTPAAQQDTDEQTGPRLKKPRQKSERESIIEQLEAADMGHEPKANYELPSVELLLLPEDISYEEHEKEVRRKAKILERTFKNFGFNVRVVEIETGPVIAQYEVQLEAGLRLSKITGLADDLAIALRVPSVRIVAPIPGKNTVGIEVPNETRQLVRLREVIEETNGKASRMKIPVYLGKDVAGNPMIVDLTSMPHLLIAGRTGTGKSVCLNTIIVSMLMSRGPDEVRMLMIDPKMVELSGYRKLPHLMHPVVTDMKKAEAILAWAVDKMEERYTLLARAGVRHVSVYNQLGEEELRDRIEPTSESEWEEIPKQLPFIVIVADEMADLMMTAGKDVEQHIIRLAQKSRAVGIHLILATQKPTVDVITGLIKSNLPARLAFQVASRTDSRVVLDEMGAEKLLGNGDMLFLSPGTSMLLRGQGTYLSDDEITRVVDFVGTDEPQFAGELMQLKTKEEVEATAGSLKNRDELYEAAIEVVVTEGRGSVSLLQRALGIGYGRAARLIDFMAEDGIVGQYNGSQAREVTITMEEWEAMKAGGDESSEPPPAPEPAPKRTNRIAFSSDDQAEQNGETPVELLDSPPAKIAAEEEEDEEEYEEEYEDDEPYDEEEYDDEGAWDEEDSADDAPEEEAYEEEYEEDQGEWEESDEECDEAEDEREPVA
ncbi:DNA translocase FtsK [Aeoliella mucimassa]|uniref:DNA translocase FtsK n=1 Tax=Aeoliella mucimassa TaxID=2527972 RepID=A0A518ART3_9BACT|nr:DNA translocase FtsK [Aeoliella mucimassa]QDU57418.1 DNA translocase FtsK [Aeoliella mucimassa]